MRDAPRTAVTGVADGLLLVSHGSRKPGAEAVLDDLARACVAAGIARRAAPLSRAFADGGDAGRVRDACARLTAEGARTVAVVPCFLSLSTAFTEVLHRAADGLPVRVTAPLGAAATRGHLADALAARLFEAAGADLARARVLVVGHGARAFAADPTHDPVPPLVALVARRVGRPAASAYLEVQSPSIPDALRAAADGHDGPIVLAPAFFLPGVHTTTDIPAAVAATGLSHRVVVALPLLDHPGIVAAVGAAVNGAYDSSSPNTVP